MFHAFFLGYSYNCLVHPTQCITSDIQSQKKCGGKTEPNVTQQNLDIYIFTWLRSTTDEKAFRLRWSPYLNLKVKWTVIVTEFNTCHNQLLKPLFPVISFLISVRFHSQNLTDFTAILVKGLNYIMTSVDVFNMNMLKHTKMFCVYDFVWRLVDKVWNRLDLFK